MRSFKGYIVSLMKDENSGPLDLVCKGVLRVISWVYGVAIRLVDISYASGIRKTYRADMPVISVGNITLGGTGKTPFVIFLADYLQLNGKRPAILTRGYGKDECKMLKDELADVPVLVGQDRVKSARKALEENAGIIILDDGFQHRRIERDVNIVMIDCMRPFGNKNLFPRGILRESVSSLKRADMFVLTRTDRASHDSVNNTKDELNKLFPGRPVILTRYTPSFLTDVTGAACAISEMKDKKILLVSGIVDHDYFQFLVKDAAGVIASRIDYDDHHAYSQKDIDRIFTECQKKEIDIVMVTKKDYVKLEDLNISQIEEKLFVLNITVDITEGKEELLAGLNSINRS